MPSLKQPGAGLLQLIAAPDEDWEAMLWSELMTALVHQGTCYSATTAMVPVLGRKVAISAWPTNLAAVRRHFLDHLTGLDRKTLATALHSIAT